MSPEIINGVIQGGALVLLALVLWGISKKVDAVLLMAEKVVMRLLELIQISTTDNATRTQDASDIKINRHSLD
jgi:hypothetical protein